jgi:hypothetical protein
MGFHRIGQTVSSKWPWPREQSGDRLKVRRWHQAGHRNPRVRVKKIESYPRLSKKRASNGNFDKNVKLFNNIK